MACLDSKGEQKGTYYSESEAQEVAEYELEEREVRLKVYKCPDCNHFHLTKKLTSY